MSTTQVDDLQGLLDHLREKHSVPGASLAVLADGELSTAVSGVTNLNTQVPVTPDTLFQIGSTTKSYTATLVMQLVDEGKLELDQPAADVIPDFRFGPDEDGRLTTIRQLLAHTSGMIGDEFGNFPASDDWGRGDEAIERYVAICGNLPRIAPQGSLFSYNNAAYVVLGRIIEILREKPYARALQEHLLAPLGCEHSALLAEEVIMYRVAVGHTPNPEDLKASVVAPMWSLPPAIAPAGLLCASASDVMKFAQLHLDAGVGPDGTRLLSSESATEMQRKQVDLPWPNALYAAGNGLGLILFDWGGHRGYGHNGDTIGQHCEFRVFPGRNIAFALLGNGGLGLIPFAEEFTKEILGSHGIPMPLREPVTLEGDLSRFVGTFESPSMLIKTRVDDDLLVIDLTPQGPSAALSIVPPLDGHPLVPIGPGAFELEVFGLTTPLTFFDFGDDDSPRYLLLGGRAIPRG